MIIEADGKRFQVRHLCHSTDAANEFCAADIKINGKPTIGVIDVDEATGTTILADVEPLKSAISLPDRIELNDWIFENYPILYSAS